MKNSSSIEIDCPIDQVFRLTRENVADWSLIVIEDESIEEKPEGVGSTFRVVTEEHGKQMEFQGIVTAYDAPHLHRVKMVGKSFDIDSEFTFAELSPDRTLVTQSADVTGKGFFKIILFCTGWMMKKSQCEASNKELESLRAFCEKNREAADEG